jgi:hypothetical protein
MKLYRIQEAYNYFRLSEAIYEANLGTYHERTLTVNFLIGNLKVKRNKMKCMKGNFDIKPTYKQNWMFYWKDKYDGVGRGGKHIVRGMMKKR